MNRFDTFFGFNDFEHCQDSFLSWLFNGYESNERCAREFAEKLARLFCEMKDQIDISSWGFEALPQRTFFYGKKKSIIDVVITVKAGDETREVYIEDKTRPDFRESQMTGMKKAVEAHFSKSGQTHKRHYVYLNTANMSDFVKADSGIEGFALKQKEKHDFIVVLRDDMLNLINEIKIPDSENKGDSIFRQYVAYLKGSSRLYDGIENMKSKSVFQMVRIILETRKLDGFLELSDRNEDYVCLGGRSYSDRACIRNKIADDGIRLFLCLKPKTKSHPKLYLIGHKSNPRRFSKIYDYIQTKLGARGKRNLQGNVKLLGDEKAFSKIDELKAFLDTSILAFADVSVSE